MQDASTLFAIHALTDEPDGAASDESIASESFRGRFPSTMRPDLSIGRIYLSSLRRRCIERTGAKTASTSVPAYLTSGEYAKILRPRPNAVHMRKCYMQAPRGRERHCGLS